MYFYQSSGFIIDFLMEGGCLFLRVHFFNVTRPPAAMTGNVKPVAPSAIRQSDPVRKLAFVLLASGHGVSLE